MDDFDISGVVQHYLFDLASEVNDNQNAVIDLQTFMTFFIQRSEECGLEGLIKITKLLQFYQDVRSQQQSAVQLKHITDYLISSASELNVHFNKKFLPSHSFRTKKRQLVQAEISPPEILGLNQDMLRRVLNDLHTIDTNSKTQIIQSLTNQHEMFLLMQFSEKVTLFEGFEFRKYIKLKKNEEGNYIQLISYGNNRLGCLLRDLSIVFWDKSDGYTFDFKIMNGIEIQKMMYLHLQDQWITINKTNQIMVWNLENASFTYMTQNLQQIVQMCEVTHLQMLLVSSNPNLINCFDMFEQKFLFKFATLHNVIVNLKYSRMFQLVFTIGLDNFICCYQLHTKYNDQSLKCQLKGHAQTINCIELIEGTALLVSIDCKNNVILWDVRSQSIHQQVKLQTKLMAKQLFYYSKCLCLITTRLQTLQFEQYDDTPKNTKLVELVYDQWNQRNIIVTRSDVRIQNCTNGKIEYILQDFKDEITAVCLIEHNNFMILGTSEGHLLKVAIKNGEIQQQWDHLFNEEIIKLCYDETSNLLHIFNIDSSLKCIPLHQLNVRKDNVVAKDKRALRQLLHHEQVNLCTFNLAHGLLITSSEDFLSIWNLEYYSVVIQIQLEDSAQATSIVLSNTHQYFIVATNFGQLFFIQISPRNEHYICTVEGLLNIDNQTLVTNNEKLYATQMIIDNQDLIIGTNNGVMLKYSITDINIPKQEAINTKPNYNPYRVIYHNNIQEHYVDNYRMMNSYLIKDMNLSQQKSPNSKIKHKFRVGMARLSAVKNMVGQLYDHHADLSSNSPLLSSQVHNDSIIQLSFMQIDPFEVLFSTKTQLIISASCNDVIKIVSKQFEVLCLFEINNPTSHFWQLHSQTFKQKAHILFALELLKSIQHKLSKEKQTSYNIDNILRECSLLNIKNKSCPSHKQTTATTSSLPDLVNKTNHSLRFYNEKLKYQKQLQDIQQLEKQIEDTTNKRNRYFQNQQQQNQKKEILEYLRSEDKSTEHEDFRKTLLNLRMKTEPKSTLQISKLTRTSNYTELTNRSYTKFPRHSKEVFDLIKQVISSPQKRVQTEVKSEIRSKLKSVQKSKII